MLGLKITVVRMGGGYWRAILRNGEQVYGCDLSELIGRLKTRASVLPVPPKYVSTALEIVGR